MLPSTCGHVTHGPSQIRPRCLDERKRLLLWVINAVLPMSAISPFTIQSPTWSGRVATDQRRQKAAKCAAAGTSERTASDPGLYCA